MSASRAIPITSARQGRARGALALAGALAGIAEALQREGLRPIVDAEVEVVRAECPDCRAGERDPLALYRPLVIAPRRQRTHGHCEACGGASNV